MTVEDKYVLYGDLRFQGDGRLLEEMPPFGKKGFRIVFLHTLIRVLQNENGSLAGAWDEAEAELDETEQELKTVSRSLERKSGILTLIYRSLPEIATTIDIIKELEERKPAYTTAKQELEQKVAPLLREHSFLGVIILTSASYLRSESGEHNDVRRALYESVRENAKESSQIAAAELGILELKLLEPSPFLETAAYVEKIIRDDPTLKNGLYDHSGLEFMAGKIRYSTNPVEAFFSISYDLRNTSATELDAESLEVGEERVRKLTRALKEDKTLVNPALQLVAQYKRYVKIRDSIYRSVALTAARINDREQKIVLYGTLMVIDEGRRVIEADETVYADWFNLTFQAEFNRDFELGLGNHNGALEYAREAYALNPTSENKAHLDDITTLEK